MQGSLFDEVEAKRQIRELKKIPFDFYYRYVCDTPDNEVEEAEEWLLIVKTTRRAFERVRDAINELHSYDVPECISISIESGSLKYLNWLGESVK